MTAYSAGDRPRGLGGAVYLLVCLFVYLHLFMRQYKRSLMLSVGGQGILSNAVYPYWIAQVP